MKTFYFLILLGITTASCTKISDDKNDTFMYGSGVFIVNEGNFMWGNGSVSFYSYDSARIYNNIFSSTNDRPLGDTPNSLAIINDNVYIVVNNSGKIEVVNTGTFESVATISGLISPRNMAIVNSKKGYISSIYSDSLTIIDLATNSISGYINLRRSSESIILSGSKAYISNWLSGNEIIVVNTTTDKVIDSVEVSIEPESMVLDKNNVLWVLCNGGWARNNYAKLFAINTATSDIIKEMVFPSKQSSPVCLQIDGKGETLYYLENGLRKMDINASALPETSFIPQSDNYFYKLGINPVNGDIFITDALDYQQKGMLLYYKKDGTLIETLYPDIIPGFMYFMLNDSFKAE